MLTKKEIIKATTVVMMLVTAIVVFKGDLSDSDITARTILEVPITIKKAVMRYPYTQTFR